MKNSILYTIMAVLLLSTGQITAQGLQRKSLDSFKEIVINGTADVYINTSNEYGISAKTDDLNSINYIIKNDVLELNTGAAKTVYIHTATINRLTANGAGDVYSSDTLKGTQLDIKSNGTGKMNLLAKYSTITAVIAGSSDLKISGTTNQFDAVLSGAGNIKSYGLKAIDAEIKVSGAGDAQVNVSNRLEGSVSGVGTIYHLGDPKELMVEVSGIGEVKKSNNLITSDTTRIKFGNKKIIILDNDEKSEIEIGDDVEIDGEIKGDKKQNKPGMPSIWSGFELGINGYLNADNTFNMDSVNTNWSLNYGKSVALNFNIWEARGRILKENIIITTGLGAEINNYRFENNTRLLSDTVPVIALVEPNKDYDKSKLLTGYLNVPLYLTFATNKFKNGKRLSISPGVTGGWRFASYNKRVVNENGDRNKTRNKDDFNLNPFRLNASIRIGYGDFILFANYSLTPLFQKNEGPLLTPVTIGVRVIGFGKS
jgi:hypothetical protein